MVVELILVKGGKKLGKNRKALPWVVCRLEVGSYLGTALFIEK